MSARFAAPRQGKGPSTGRSALALCGCLIGVGVGYSQMLYPKVRSVLVENSPQVDGEIEAPIRRIAAESVPEIPVTVAPEILVTVVPEIPVTVAVEEIEDNERAADLYGTILRSVRSARARREEEKRHNGGSSPQAQRRY